MASLDATVPVLLYLLGASKASTRTKVQQQLGPYYSHQAGLLDATIDDLLADGRLEGSGRNRVALSDAGRDIALKAAGLESAAGLTWQRIAAVELVANALNLPVPRGNERRRLASADGLRAAVLNQSHQLGLTPYPTLNQVRDALLWQSLDRAAESPELLQGCKLQLGRPFSIRMLAGLLLSNRLGSQRVLEAPVALRQLATAAVRARRTDPAELRLAIVRHALRLSAEKTKPLVDLNTFADRVLKVAARCRDGWFGSQKLFIAPLWTQFRKAHPEIEETEFRNKLLEAHRQGLLRLARADLIPAMDPELVAASELQYWGAAFHFLSLDEHKR